MEGFDDFDNDFDNAQDELEPRQPANERPLYRVEKVIVLGIGLEGDPIAR
jgi:hypothetical protein